MFNAACHDPDAYPVDEANGLRPAYEIGDR